MATFKKSLQGQLLLDGGKLHGSFFHRTVVLICQHDAEGAFGLILNRSTGKTIDDVIVANLPKALKQEVVYIGGPVQPAALSFLHSDLYLPQASVMPNLNLGHSLDALLELGESYSNTQKIKLFAGYAGWTAGQLDDEMARNDWLVHPASLDLIFTPEPEQLWQKILRSRDYKGRLLAEAPEDLSWN